MKKQSQHRTIRDFFKAEYENLKHFVRIRLDESLYRVSPEDVIQDVALNIFNQIDLDGYVENCAGYVYKAIKNKITDFYRKRGPLSDPLNKLTDEGKLPDIQSEEDCACLNTDKFYSALFAAIEKLSPDQQSIVIQTEFEGETFEALSKRWDIPVGTLLSRKSRAMKKLREWINPEDLFDEP